MSGVATAIYVAAAVGAMSLGYSVYAGQQSAAQQKRQLAQQQQQQDAQIAQQKAQMKQSEEATNQANQKAPDKMILEKEKMAASQGVGETMLTGQLGIPQEKLSLAKKTTLLGS